MTRVYQGKTKDVYKNPSGTYTLVFKDTATGKDGVFDPGENAVGLSIDGLGRESIRMSQYFFEKINEAGIPNHYVECDINASSMTVLPAKAFGNGIEFICRLRADGSFVRRYGAYTKHGDKLDYVIEATIKDDARKDPPINQDTMLALKIMTQQEYDICLDLTKKTTQLIAAELAAKGLELYDIKYEFGKNDDNVILIDEFSAGIMRAYKDGKPVPPMELATMILPA